MTREKFLMRLNKAQAAMRMINEFMAHCDAFDYARCMDLRSQCASEESIFQSILLTQFRV